MLALSTRFQIANGDRRQLKSEMKRSKKVIYNLENKISLKMVNVGIQMSFDSILVFVFVLSQV